MNHDEVAVTFTCGEESLVGIVARPERPEAVGVLVIVGGPQYRVGSHRQFVHLSRFLARNGVPCMRFDYRGMGDSGGVARTFEAIEEDIAAALDVFQSRMPAIQRVVLWGLCDGASAAALYAPLDPRVSGLILVNPWVRTEASAAATHLRYYYPSRVVQAAFWRKVLNGDFDLRRSLREFFGALGASRRSRASTGTPDRLRDRPLPARLATAMGRFPGKILIVLSGNDLVAAEFKEVAAASREWRRALDPQRTEWRNVAAATHTLSSEAWRAEAAQLAQEWIHRCMVPMANAPRPTGTRD